MSMRMRIPVLTYHSVNIHGNDYATNDHVALASDLRTLTDLGLRIAPLPAIVDALQARTFDAMAERCVAVTLDDGQDFDYVDLPHPTWGPQRSMVNVLRDFRDTYGVAAQPQLHATSFVIVSPDARRRLDVTCMIGCGWWNDDWWPIAAASGLLAIGNHSWDHNHATLDLVAQREQRKGTFLAIDTFVDAEAQIAQAATYLRAKADNAGASLFAYPYGESNDYLVREYFPQHGARIRIRAAFGGAPEPVTTTSSIWDLPRYICGHHWKNPAELVALLRDAL
jgi:Polysaccharide deacetylase